MALLTFGGDDTRQTRVTTLPGPAAQEETLRSALFGGGMGQMGAYTDLLRRAMAGPGGVPGAPAPGTMALTSGAAGDIARGFTGSKEFAGRFAADPTGTIGGLYQFGLGRTASPEEIAAWQATGQDLSGITSGILGSPEAQGRQLGGDLQAYLSGAYQNLLGRAGGAGELGEWYKALGLPEEGAGGVPADPREAMFKTAREQLTERLTGGQFVSPEMRARIDEAFGYQRGRGTRDIGRQFREQAAQRGLTELDTPITRPWAEAESDFLANLASQQAAAEIGAGQQEMGQLMGLAGLETNVMTNADANRLRLALGGPAMGLAGMLGQERAGQGITTQRTTGGGPGVSMTGQDIGAILSGLTQVPWLTPGQPGGFTVAGGLGSLWDKVGGLFAGPNEMYGAYPGY